MVIHIQNASITSKDLFGNWEYLAVKMYLQDRLYSGGFESGNLTR